MPVPVYIGDEVSASGYRLAGMSICLPQQDDPLGEIRAACAEASLVLLSSEYAGRLPDDALQLLLADTGTPVVVVPDIRGRHPLTDLATQLRRQLGVLE